jgi:hypothetical protein
MFYGQCRSHPSCDVPARPGGGWARGLLLVYELGRLQLPRLRPALGVLASSARNLAVPPGAE